MDLVKLDKIAKIGNLSFKRYRRVNMRNFFGQLITDAKEGWQILTSSSNINVTPKPVKIKDRDQHQR